VPCTTVNLNVIEPVALPLNRTRPSQPALAANGVRDQILDNNWKDVDSTPPVLEAASLPTSICRLSQLTIEATTT
jgi:hypothetical protein